MTPKQMEEVIKTVLFLNEEAVEVAIVECWDVCAEVSDETGDALLAFFKEDEHEKVVAAAEHETDL